MEAELDPAEVRQAKRAYLDKSHSENKFKLQMEQKKRGAKIKPSASSATLVARPMYQQGMTTPLYPQGQAEALVVARTSAPNTPESESSNDQCDVAASTEYVTYYI